MVTRIEILTKGTIEAQKTGLLSRIPIRVYNIDDDSLNDTELAKIKQFLTDPITEISTLNRSVLLEKQKETSILTGDIDVIDVSFNPGVKDRESESAKTAIEDILERKIGRIAYTTQYLFRGNLEKELPQLKPDLGTLVNHNFKTAKINTLKDNLIEYTFPEVDDSVSEFVNYDLTGNNMRLDGYSDNMDLSEIVSKSESGLETNELKVIRDLFKKNDFLKYRKELGLDPCLSDAELGCIAQTWSDHSCHKTFNAKWIYTSEDLNDISNLPKLTDSIFKSIIMQSTKDIREKWKQERKKDWVVSVYSDNAGIVELNSEHNIAFKVETHNHPSSLEGFGGANTGIGGVIRDGVSTGIFARPRTASCAFNVPLLDSYSDLPLTMQTPWTMLNRCVNGIGDYGNKVGVPTTIARVFYDDDFLKPAVYAGITATVPSEMNGKKTHIKDIKPGYIGISLGGRVGRDGIDGAKLSSTYLSANAETDTKISSSVQIGDPIEEQMVIYAAETLANLGLIEYNQDVGGGGLSSALGELSEVSGGAKVDLTDILLKYPGLTTSEKHLSESQERIVIAIKPENKARFFEVTKHLGVEATVVAEFNDSGYYTVSDNGRTEICLPVDLLHNGMPQTKINAHYKPTKNNEPEIAVKRDYTEDFLNVLSHPNVQFDDWILQSYDHEVQGGILLKQKSGIGGGRSDTVICRPVPTEKEIQLETQASNPRQGEIDAYHMGYNNVVSALGQIVAAGGTLDRVSFNGNTVTPKPKDSPDIAAKVIRMIKGAADAEILFGTPTISGKDSCSMQRKYTSTEDGEEKEVFGKPEIFKSALGIVPDDSTVTSPGFKLVGDLIYVVGKTKNELGASIYYQLNNQMGANVPISNGEEIKINYKNVESAIKKQSVHSCQSLERGGLTAALSNSAICGNLGFSVNLDNIDDGLDRADSILMSESTGRQVITIHPSQKELFESSMKDSYCKQIGYVREGNAMKVQYKNKQVVNTNVDIAKERFIGKPR